MKVWFSFVIQRAAFDKSILITFTTRLVNIIGGLALIYFVSRYLSPLEQGYYYTFFSIVALQVFVELGLNYAVIQMASHEMADLQWTNDRLLIGKAAAKKRLQSLMKFSMRWFAYAGFLIMLILMPLGIWFFHQTSPNTLLFELNSVLALLLISTASLFLTNNLLAILEGCNKVADVALIKFFQTISSTLLICYGLINGFGLYSLVMGSIASFCIGAGLIYIFFKKFFIDLLSFISKDRGMSWRDEIWPFQMKIGLSWVAGYLIFQIYSPLLVAFGYQIEAGQMGMSLQIISAVNGIFIIWITTKASIFGQLIAKNNRKELDAIFRRAFIQSTILLILALSTLVFALYWISLNLPHYYARVVDLKCWIILSFACLANHIFFSEAAYLRAHKEELLMKLSLINGVSTFTLALILIPITGIIGAVICYGFSSILIGLIGGTIIFLKKRNECIE
jgi:O-antigen/teichoic acid export membrane protein